MERKPFRTPGNNKIYFVLLFFAVIVTGFLLKNLSSVFLPVVLSVMLAFILLPIIKKMNAKLHLPWILSSILVLVLFLVIFLGLFSLLLKSLTTIISEYPKYEKKFMSIYQIIAQSFNLEFDESKSFIENVWKFLKVQEVVQNMAVFLSSGMVNFGKNLFNISLLCIFLLIEMRLTKQKIYSAFDNDEEKVNKISHQVAHDTVNYISIKFFISLCTGLLVFLITWILKMDFSIVWAFLAFIMNFIPIFGSIISVSITTLFAILQFYPSIGKPIFVLIFMIVVNFGLGNILEPRIEGKNLGLSPFVILVCLSLWGYIWGFVGMILAVPMTVIIKIICENTDYLKSIGILLGNGNDIDIKQK